LREVGELLNYYVVTEYRSESYRFDVAWWGSKRDLKDGKHPVAVFRFIIAIVQLKPWLGLSMHHISGTSTDYTW
jgi:hypothetical protein